MLNFGSYDFLTTLFGNETLNFSYTLYEPVQYLSGFGMIGQYFCKILRMCLPIYVSIVKQLVGVKYTVFMFSCFVHLFKI